MFSFFDRKDVRKILKRKDSDPGEQGTPVSCFLVFFMSVLCLVYFFGIF